MFIAALFIIVRTWKQPRCPSADEWIRKLWYIYTMEYYSAVKKEYIWISFNEVDETGAHYTEWSKPERKTPIQYAAAAAAKSLQSCLTLCDPIDGSPPGSSVPGFLQARTLEWVAISFSNAWKWKVKVKSLSRSLPGSSVHGIFQARVLEWGAIAFSVIGWDPTTLWKKLLLHYFFFPLSSWLCTFWAEQMFKYDSFSLWSFPRFLCSPPGTTNCMFHDLCKTSLRSCFYCCFCCCYNCFNAPCS